MSKHYKMKCDTGHYEARMDSPSFNVYITPTYDNWKFKLDSPFKGFGFRQIQIKEGDTILHNIKVFSFGKRVYFELKKEQALKAHKTYLLTIK